MNTYYIGTHGDLVFGTDTIGGVPAFTFQSIKSRILTKRGRRPWHPDYGADFASCVKQDDPWMAESAEIKRALADDVAGLIIRTGRNRDLNAIQVEIAGEDRSRDWSLRFDVSLEDGSIERFPSEFVVRN